MRERTKAGFAVGSLAAGCVLGAAVLASDKVVVSEIFFYLAARFLPLFLAGVVLLPGLIYGDTVLRLLSVELERKRYYYFTAIVLGLGIIGHLVLVLGMLHLLRIEVFLIILCATFIVRIRAMKAMVRDVVQWGKRAARMPFSLVTVLLMVLVVSAVMVLYLVSFAPSVSYDVLEYHLAVPEKFVREGSIFAVPYNFFSCLPFEVEMLYTFEMVLGGGLGDMMPKLVNFWLLLLGCAGIYLVLQRLRCETGWRLSGILFYLTHTIVFRLGIDAFVGLGTAVFAVAALLLFLQWREGYCRKVFVLMSVFLGLALCTKYSVAVVFIVPFMSVLFVHAVWKERMTTGERLVLLLKRCVLAAVIIVVVFSPWLLKNLITTGNPFYPFAASIVPSPGWSEAQSEFLTGVHAIKNVFSFSYVSSVVENLRIFGVLYWIVLLLGILYRGKSSYVRPLSIVIGLSYLLWCTGTYFPDRFLAPLVPFLVVACVLILRNYVSVSTWSYLLVILFFFSVTQSLGNKYRQVIADDFVRQHFGLVTEKEFMERHLKGLMRVVNAANENLPEKGKILLLYEARDALFDGESVSNTVFDKSPLLEMAKVVNSGEELYDRLKEEGFTHCFVNEYELYRLIRFYGNRGKIDRYYINLDNPEEVLMNEYLYPPYDLDPSYMTHRGKIVDFLEKLKKRIVAQYPESQSAGYVYCSELE